MANSIAYPILFQKELDEAYAAQAVTAWMTRNARMAKYTGGHEIKIPKMSMDGMADYSKSAGYQEGDVTVEYQTMSMSRDRGRGFTFDAHDVEESGFIVTAGTVMGQFQRKHVVPEVDAYNLSKVYAKTPTGNVKTYTPAASTVFGKLKDDIAAVRDIVGSSVRLMIHISNSALNVLEQTSQFSRMVNPVDMGDQLKTKLRGIDNDPFIPTGGNLMKTAFNFWAGSADASTGSGDSAVVTDKKAGGFDAKSDAKAINWLIIPEDAPISVCKQDQVRTFSPETWQKSNSWHCDYRRYFDLWVPDNQTLGLWANIGA